MSDKDKIQAAIDALEAIQAAIDALEALEGLPIARDMDRALFDLRLELDHPYSDPYYACKACNKAHTERSVVRSMMKRGGYCHSCWWKVWK